MNRLNPFTLTTRLKIVYNQHASKLPLKFKLFLLVVVSLSFFDNVFGISYTLITNSKLDTVERFIESKPQLPITYMIDYQRNLANDFIHHRTLYDEFADCFNPNKGSDGCLPLAMTLSSALLFFMMMIIVVYQLLRVVLLGKRHIYNHIANLLLIIVALALIVWIMRWCMAFIPMICDNWGWNYALNILVNVCLLAAMLLMLPIESMSESVQPQMPEDNELGGVSVRN